MSIIEGVCFSELLLALLRKEFFIEVFLCYLNSFLFFFVPFNNFLRDWSRLISCMNVNALIFERMDWIKHSRCLLNWYHDYNVCEILIKKSQVKIPKESVYDSAVTNLPLYQSNYMLLGLEGYIDKLSIHYTLTFKAIHVASWQMEEAFVKKRKTASELLSLKLKLLWNSKNIP